MKLLAAVLLLAFSCNAWSDVVSLKNGDRISGTVDSISGGHVLLITEYAGAMTIKLDAIAHITTEAAFDVNIGDDQVNGQFQVVSDKQVLVTQMGTKRIAIADVSIAGQSSFVLPHFALAWTTRADLAANVANGNTDLEKYNVQVESTLKDQNVEHDVTLDIINEKSEEIQTREEFDLEYGYKRFLSESWYASGNAEYFKDPFNDTDSRITVGAGIGHQFWRNSFGALSSELSLNYVQEDVAGETKGNHAVRWGLKYNHFFFNKKLEAFHKQSVLFILDSERGEVIETSTGLRYALNYRIDAVARVDVNRETRPASDRSKSDITYNLGIGIKF